MATQASSNTSNTFHLPYVPLQLQGFPTDVFHENGMAIYPMWSGEGNLSYFIVNPKLKEAFIIDPDLEILGSYLLTLHQLDLKLTAIIDTHTHAEHATAAPALIKLFDVPYLMHHQAPSSFVTDRLNEGDNNEDERIIAGTTLRFMSASGHTPDLFVVIMGSHIFTGDSLFNQSCGRADFPGSDAGEQFDSLQRLKALPEGTLIHPGHDYNNRLSVTLGEARKENSRLQFLDRAEFVAFMDEHYKGNEKPDDWVYYASFNAS